MEFTARYAAPVKVGRKAAETQWGCIR